MVRTGRGISERDPRSEKPEREEGVIMFTYARAWLLDRFHGERGQGAIEYVLVILGVVLFLIVAAFGLRGGLDTAVSAVTDWIGSVTAPSIPGT
jgi:hypothetical protein